MLMVYRESIGKERWIRREKVGSRVDACSGFAGFVESGNGRK